MKKKIHRPAIRTMAVIILLSVVVAGWHFTRPQLGFRSASDELTSAHQTKVSDRAATDPAQERRRQESISRAAQAWYEELLEKYPGMKPAFREVPDEQNGFLHFLQLAEDLKEPRLPQNLWEMFGRGAAWDAGKFDAWLAENTAYRDEILRVAELPDRSVKGLDLDRLARSCRHTPEFGSILSGSARLAFEAGDQEAALRYARASIRLAGHLTGIEAPSFLGLVVAEGYRGKIMDSFLEHFMPALTNDPHALATWRETLAPKEPPATEYARVVAGEWNVMLRTITLPALLGGYSPPENAGIKLPDTEAFFDAFTSATQKLAANLANSAPGYLDLSENELDFSDSGLDPTTRESLGHVSYRGLLPALGIQATRAAMISAAVAVQLGEEPPVDPVSGRPFQWNPDSRTLSLPEGIDGSDPIKLR